MAEILGVVASGISVAQLAGQILSAGLEIKRLLDQVNQAPEHLTLLVNQIESLAIVLADIVQQDDGCDLAIPSATRGTLRSSVAQCQQALEQVTTIAVGLSAQIGITRGVRRKLLAFKVVLRSDFILACERRLNMAMNLLLLAQQSYILAFQRMQPSLLLSLIEEHAQACHSQKGATSRREEKDEAEALNTAQREHKAKRETKSGAVTQKDNWHNVPGYHFGFTSITGRIDVRFANLNTPGTSSAFKIHIQLPPWVSQRHLETIFRQSCGDWTTVLRVYRTHPPHSAVWQAAMAAIAAGDILSLRKQFESRILTPHDQLWYTAGTGVHTFTFVETLMDTAMGRGVPDIGHFLAGYGVNTGPLTVIHKLSPAELRPNDEDWETKLLEFVRLDEPEASMCFNLLRYFRGSTTSFRRLRRLIWTDDEFYGPDFGHHGKGRAALIDAFLDGKTAPPEVIRQILNRDGDIPTQEELAGAQMSNSVLKWSMACLARSEFQALVALTNGKGFSADLLQDSSATHWLDLSRDLLSLDPGCTAMNLGDISGAVEDHVRTYLRWVGHASVDNPPRSGQRHTHQCPLNSWCKQMRACTRFPEFVIQRWISLLENLGYDLTAYGIAQKRMTFRSCGCDGDALFETSLDEWCYEPRIRLVGLEYGPRASDWRFWWSEPSDDFVGEFWDMVDRDLELEEAIRRIPGGWMEDE